MDYKNRLNQYFKTPLTFNVTQINNDQFQSFIDFEGQRFVGDVCTGKKKAINSTAKRMCECMKITYTDSEYKQMADTIYEIIKTNNKSNDLRKELHHILNNDPDRKRQYSNKEIKRIINNLVEMLYLVRISYGRDSFYFHPSDISEAMDFVRKQK